MSLKNYTAPRKDIPLGNGESVSVRGLNLEDISFLVQVHHADVDRLVETFRGRLQGAASGGQVDPAKVEQAIRDNSSGMLVNFVQHFPLLVANVIALAADEPNAWENATKLPIPVQTEAVVEIARLTFEDYNGFKKFVGNVVAAAQSVAKRPPQQNSSKKTTKSTGSTD